MQKLTPAPQHPKNRYSTPDWKRFYKMGCRNSHLLM